MKKKMMSIAAIVICLSILTSGTLAYRTVADTARNVITSNGIGVELVEQQLVGDTLVEYPNKDIPVMPTAQISKIVSAKNNEAPAWIRMAYTMTVKDANGNTMNISQEELAKVILIDANDENWTEKDGWFYYNTAVGTDETTAPLFTQVEFSGPNMDNKYQQTTVKINVVVQAVQKANNGTTALDAAGWPEAT